MRTKGKARPRPGSLFPHCILPASNLVCEAKGPMNSKKRKFTESLDASATRKTKLSKSSTYKQHCSSVNTLYQNTAVVQLDGAASVPSGVPTVLTHAEYRAIAVSRHPMSRHPMIFRMQTVQSTNPLMIKITFQNLSFACRKTI